MKIDRPGYLNVMGEIQAELPPYPEEAREEGIEGTLELLMTVARNGEVADVRVLKSLDPAIDDAAVATVRTWRFKVTRGEVANFTIKISYQLTFSSDPN